MGSKGNQTIEKFFETSQPSNHYNNRGMDFLKTIGLIFLVVALGMLAVNQSLEFYYRAEFLKAPCSLCAELNPDVEVCIQNLSDPRPSYWTMEGWTDPYNQTIKNISID